MSISDNNFELPEVPSEGDTSQTLQPTESGSLGEHSVSTLGEENPQISGQGEKAIQHLGEESTEFHHLPPGISVTTSAGDNVERLSEDIHFSINSSGSPSLSRSSSFSSISSASEFSSLDNTRNSSPISSSNSIFSNSSKLEDTLSPLPKYSPNNKASIQKFLRDPRILANMKEKGGHYIYVDSSRSSFIFIPNGDFSQAKSIKITNGKSKEPIQNPQDLEMCISKFATVFNQVETNWENKESTQIRQRLGLSEDSPVKFTHFTLNLKEKQAIAYGPFNQKEAASGYTPSAWQRGTKVNVNKDVWGDTGSLNSVDLSKQTPTEENDEKVHYTSETPSNIHQETLTEPGMSSQPTQPVVININVAGGQGGQGGSSTNISHPQETSSSNKDLSPEAVNKSTTTNSTETDTDSDVGSTADSEITTTSTIEEPSVVVVEEPGKDNLASNNFEQIQENNPSSLKDILKKVRSHLDFVNEYGPYGQQLGDVIRNNTNTQEKSPIPSLALLEEPELSSSNKSFIDAAKQTSEKLQDLLSSVINAPKMPLPNPQTETAKLETILKAVRTHVNSVYSPNGKRQIGGIASIIKATENRETKDAFSSENITKSKDVDTEKIYTKRSPNESISVSSPQTLTNLQKSLDLSEKNIQTNKDSFINAIKETSSSLQQLLNTVINVPDNSLPNPSAEINQLATILKAVRTHVKSAYSPNGKRQIGGIASIIKATENQ